MNDVRQNICKFLASGDALIENDDIIDVDYCTNRIIQFVEEGIESLADQTFFDNIHDANQFRFAINKIKEMLK